MSNHNRGREFSNSSLQAGLGAQRDVDRAPTAIEGAMTRLGMLDRLEV